MATPLMLENEVAGNDLSIERDVPGITVTDPLVKAWLTIKVNRSDADPGALQKVITTAQVVGTGQITQDGSEANGNGTGTVWVQLTAAETTALGTLIRYYWDIQAKSASGLIYQARDPNTDQWVGRMQFRPRVTLATT